MSAGALTGIGGVVGNVGGGAVLSGGSWRWLFAASIVPIAVLSLVRWRWLAQGEPDAAATEPPATLAPSRAADRLKLSPAEGRAFARCFAIASLTIASGTVNVFFAKELPQSSLYTVLFWGNVAPGMLLGAWIVRRAGVRRALVGYAVALVALSAFAWASAWDGRKLAFALILPLLNGIPFGLMGAYFNEAFTRYRTMLSGAAYNLGRILAGFAPVLITALGLRAGGHYFLFTAALGVGVFAVGWGMTDDNAAGRQR